MNQPCGKVIIGGIMASTVKTINAYFKHAIKSDVNDILSKLILTERQDKIFSMFYLEKKDIDFIADTLNVCRTVVNTELRLIRNKVSRIL